MGTPSTIQGFFAGTLLAYQQSLGTEPLLVVTALLCRLHRAGCAVRKPGASADHHLQPAVGQRRAMLALMLFGQDLNVISIIGIVLLIGIVKKNAIMMIDFALQAEREERKSTADAIFEACMLRFRPILMTTTAALFGAVPLAFGTGTGSELRRPLGIAIIGGLIVSQMLTLYTTPVVYLYMDRFSLWWARRRATEPSPSAATGGRLRETAHALIDPRTTGCCCSRRWRAAPSARRIPRPAPAAAGIQRTGHRRGHRGRGLEGGATQ